MKVAVIGGGAAGFFAAIAVKENHPKSDVTIFEKTAKLLSKVKVSGGGRCNVTNGCSAISKLSKAYPRGERQLKKLLRIFNTNDTIDWFEKRGVPLMIQDDDCVFPVSQDSQSIIDCFLKQARRFNIKIEIRTGVKTITSSNGKLDLAFTKGRTETASFDKVIVATGGSPKRIGLEWFEDLKHTIEDPVPSLFTFNMPDETVVKLMGVVVEKTLVSIQGTKLVGDGPLLITHWGMSGPAILKLSAFGARILEELGYQFNIQVNWVNEKNNHTIQLELEEIIRAHPKKLLSNYRPFGLPERLWNYLLKKRNLPINKTWNELGKKGVNQLVTVLTNDEYKVRGKTTFKEEFVTCGGVSLESINMTTLESKVCKNLYFAGEVMDIDAITGGYNFQSAWTTAFVAGKLQ